MKIGSRFHWVVHYVDGDQVYASAGRSIYQSFDGGKSWSIVCRLPLSPWGRLAGMTRLSRRLFRAGIHHLRPVDEERLIALGFGAIFSIQCRQGKAECVGKIVGSRPLALCSSSRGVLYYGEYRDNPERSDVHVWGSADGGLTWEPVFPFTGVRHIHGVFADPYSKSIWVTSGDLDEEAAIWRSDDDFATVDRILSGSQQTRAVTLLFTRESVFFGSDTPCERNFLYRLDRASGRLDRIAEVGGSVFYGCRVGNRLFFSTACEPSGVNRCREAQLWSSKSDGSWTKMLTFPKDMFHMKYFQYGQILFPAGPGQEGFLWLTPFATRPDQVSWKVILDAAAS